VARKGWIFLLGLVIIYSCAKVTVSPVDNDRPYTQGIRFYRPHPYLLVTEKLETLGRRTLEGSIIYLPQKKEEYVIQVQPGIGKVDVKLKLEHGWRLTDFGEVRDSKTPETIEAFSDLLPEAGDILVKSFAPDKQLEENKLSPGLWRFEFDENGYVKGLLKIIEFEKQ
jgi:nitrogen fixation protein